MIRFWLACLPWVLAHSLVAQSLPPRLVWTDASGEGRLQSAFFRYALDLPAAPDSAVISLFADSRYHLRVNGTLVAFGPARHYPAHPEYDRHDLRPYLRPGANVIAVQVLSNGTSSFQLRWQPAAFIAWGSVVAGAQAYDLRTPGAWQARPVAGLDPDAPRMSFALPAMEVYDARPDPQDWAQPGHDSPGWNPPVLLDRQGAWGNFRPRSIPPLTRDRYRPYTLAGAYRLDDSQQVWSSRVKVPDQTNADFRQGRPLLGYTYIYSPRPQTVPVGLWWGAHYLNGKGPLPQAPEPGEEGYRQRATLHLKKGWNALQVRQASLWGIWDFYFSAPRSAGLMLSPHQQRGDSSCFRTLGPLDPAQAEALTALALPFDPVAVAAQVGAAWEDQPLRPVGVNPATDLAWQGYGEPLPVAPGQTDSLTVPDGSALIFDFRYKKLARILIDYDAPAGTVLDVGFTEDTLGHRPWMLKRHGLYMAHRHIAAGGPGRLETFRPYGLRFVQVHVRESGGQPVQIHRVRAMQHVYPMARQGDFTCSDPLFNAIWELGWRTLQVCAEDSYTDTPFRERGLYAGDMLPQMGVTLACSGDLRLVRRSLRLFQDMYADVFQPDQPRHPDEIALLEDYPLLTLEALRWYVDHTQDTALLAALYPAYRYHLRQQLARRDEAGLIHNQQVFIDWIQLDKRQVQNAAYHALLGRSCAQLAELAERLGRPAEAAEWRAGREALAASLQAAYWDPAMGAYRDGLKDGLPIDHHFPISSAWPYLFDLSPEGQAASVLAHIATKMDRIGTRNRHRETNPYGSFYLLSALYRAGRAAEAERFMRQHWSPMILKHDDTAWENFGSEGIGTLSHAWSGSPTFFLSTQVLGVDLGWPHPFAADTVRIAPQAEGIDWAEGTVPHPAGPVWLRWEVRGDALWLWYDAPAGMPVVVAPQGRLGQLRLVKFSQSRP